MIRLMAVVLLATATAAIAAQPNTAAPDPANKPEQAGDKGDRMICKRLPVTGSLVSSYRSCKTKREWENVRDNRTTMNAINTCGLAGNCP
jgi:hypothetical protein